MNVTFPSLEFFQAIRGLMGVASERFERLGYFDSTFAVRILGPQGSRDYVLVFEVYECTEVREVNQVSLDSVDFVLEADQAVWEEMFRNIQRNGHADAAHGINTLTHFGETMRTVYDDPDGHDKMYRFAESMQAFFDLAAQLDINYASLPASREIEAHA